MVCHLVFGVAFYGFERPRRFRVHGSGSAYPGMPFRVLSGPAGLGCTAPGTAYPGMPFRVLSGPAGVGCTVPGTAYKGMPFGVLSGPAGLGCTAPGTAYNGMPFRDWSGSAGLGCTAPGLRTRACLMTSPNESFWSPAWAAPPRSYWASLYRARSPNPEGLGPRARALPWARAPGTGPWPRAWALVHRPGL